MRPVAGFIQFKNRPPADNFFTKLNKRLNNILQRQHHRPAVVNRQHIHAETGLQRRIFIQLIQHHVSLKITLDFNNHPHAVTIGLIADFRNPLNFLFFQQLGNTLYHCRFIDLIGNLVNNNRLFVFMQFFNRTLGSHDD